MTDSERSLDLLGVDAMQLGHAANMVAALPDHLAKDPMPKHLRHACLESFAINAALIAGFLIERGVVDDRLADIVDFTEDHVVRFGNGRATDPLAARNPTEVKAWLLSLLAEAVQDRQPLVLWIEAAIAGDYPTG